MPWRSACATTWPDLVLVVVGTAEEQTKVAAQITSGVVYRFLHRPVSAPRVRLFVDAALRRHEVENVERTLEQTRPDFSRFEAAKAESARQEQRGALPGIIAAAVVVVAAGAWFAMRPARRCGRRPSPTADATVVSAARRGAARRTRRAAPRRRRTPVPAPEERAAPAQAAPVGPDAAQPPAADMNRSAIVCAPPLRRRPSCRCPRKSRRALRRRRPPRRSHSNSACASSSPRRKPRCSAASSHRRPDRNAVALFRGALELDPGNTLAKAGLVRVADRLLSAAERALTAGSVEDARKMVDVAETLTPATARGAFLMMQIEREHERAALTRAKDGDAQDKLDKGATYLRLANARLRSGALIEPSEDNARFYLEAARQIVPEDPALEETSRALQKQLLDRAPRPPRRRQCRRHRTLAGECRQRRRGTPGNDRHPPLAAGHADRRARRQDRRRSPSRSRGARAQAAAATRQRQRQGASAGADQYRRRQPGGGHARARVSATPISTRCAAALTRNDAVSRRHLAATKRAPSGSPATS